MTLGPTPCLRKYKSLLDLAPHHVDFCIDPNISRFRLVCLWVAVGILAYYGKVDNRWFSVSPASVHPIVETAAHICPLFFALLFYRFAPNYAKWAFPLLELTGQTSRACQADRALWTAIVVSIAAALGGDVFEMNVSLANE